MSASEIEQAKRHVAMARARLESSAAAIQYRLKPGNLATEAWDGVKDKSEALTETALAEVRKRPVAVSLAAGALALFLTRRPLIRAVGRLLSRDEEDDRITTVIPTDDERFSAAAPSVAASVTEGVI
jgi:hypothetical protein